RCAMTVQQTVSSGVVEMDGTGLDPRLVARLARDATSEVALSRHSRVLIEAGREHLEEKVRNGQAVYGATTGVGGFANWLLTPGQAAALQNNLIAAVASNAGDHLPGDVVRAGMLARINTLCRGHSGVRVVIVQQLIDMFNRGVVPCVPSLGSLGASGDL